MLMIPTEIRLTRPGILMEGRDVSAASLGLCARLFTWTLVSCILLSLAGCAAPGRIEDFTTVVIDAGHGAHDPGARSPFSAPEKNLALDTAKRLEKHLRRAGFRTVMTRSTDKFIPLDRRAQISNRTGNAIFVSIHYNWSPKRSSNGIETYYYSGGNRDSRILARNVQRELLKLRVTNRGVKTARFRVLRLAKHPAILVEGGFLSSPSDARKINRASYRDAIAKRVADGIIRSRYGTLNPFARGG